MQVKRKDLSLSVEIGSCKLYSKRWFSAYTKYRHQLMLAIYLKISAKPVNRATSCDVRPQGIVPMFCLWVEDETPLAERDEHWLNRTTANGVLVDVLSAVQTECKCVTAWASFSVQRKKLFCLYCSVPALTLYHSLELLRSLMIRSEWGFKGSPFCFGFVIATRIDEFSDLRTIIGFEVSLNNIQICL